MKSLLPLLSALLFAAVAMPRADAASPYANQYVGFWYQGGNLVAGVNVTIGEDGSVTGRGAYLDFTEINLAGTVSDTGALSLIEADGHNDPFDFTAQFTPNGKKFVARTGDGYVFRAKKLSGSFLEAGVYSYEDDDGEEGVLLFNRNGLLYGYIYDEYGNSYEIDGTADEGGFSGTTEDGVDYEATFYTDDYSGNYDDGGGYYGGFDGSKY